MVRAKYLVATVPLLELISSIKLYTLTNRQSLVYVDLDLFKKK